MTTPETHDAAPVAPPGPRQMNALRLHRALEPIYASAPGWRGWFSTNNNNDIGKIFLIAATAFFVIGGILAMLIRAQLASPRSAFMGPDVYNQVFTMHGTIMMFLFAIPFFEAMTVYLLPAMLGTRDMAYPRLSAYGFWCYLIGASTMIVALIAGIAPDGGWFMYPPLSSDLYSRGINADVWLLGISFIEISAISAAVEVVVTVLRYRAAGMSLDRLPIFAWYILIVAVMILTAFPPMILGSILLELERAFGWPFFQVDAGGDALLWQHLFWIFGHPEVYIIFLPSIALLAMIIPTFARRPLLGYSWIVLAAVGTGFLSFGLWVHHMYATGLPAISLGFFSAASEAVAIPTGVQIFVFLATLLTGRVIYSVPMLWVSGALAIFVLGGLTGVMEALVPFDWQVHDTYFIVAHLHYVIIGGVLFPIVAGIYYYWPIVSSRRLSDRAGKIAFWLMFTGFNLAFFPMHYSGLIGMPRRIWTYPGGLGFDLPNLLSSVGAFVFAAGFLIVVVDVLRPRKDKHVARNVWNAGTLEWAGEVPDQPWGVRSVPIVTTRYPLWDQPNFVDDVDKGRFYMPDAEEMKRETMVTTVLDARPVQALRVPGPSFVPMVAAFFLGGCFIAATFHYWTLTIAALVLAIAVIMFWLWKATSVIPEKDEKDVGLGLTLPIYVSGPHSVSWWAMFITMLGDSTAFLSLIFGYLFYFTVHENFPPAGTTGPGLFWPLVALAIFAATWGATQVALRTMRAGRVGLSRLAMIFAILGSLAAGAAILAGPHVTGLQPTVHVYPAIVWLLAIWAALHAATGTLMLGYCLARSLAGQLTPKHDIDLSNVALYWHFAGLTGLVTVAVLTLVPLGVA